MIIWLTGRKLKAFKFSLKYTDYLCRMTRMKK
jgi:hypothetical protein